MSFKRLDDTAYEADKPLDSFLLKRVEANLTAAAAARAQIATYAPGGLNSLTGAQVRLRVCSYRQRAVLPFLWHKAPDLDEVKITARQVCPSSVAASGYEVRFSAFAMPLSSLSRVRLPASTASLDLSGGASSASNDELTLNVSALPPGWLLIGVCWQSGESAVSAVCAASDFTGFYSGYFLTKAGASPVLGTASSVPCMAVALKENAAKNSQTLPDLALGRQVLFHDYNGLSTDYRHVVYVYPPIATRGSDSSSSAIAPAVHNVGTDSLFKVDLGYVDVSSITIHDSSLATPPSTGALLDAGEATSTTAARVLIKRAHREWLSRPRVHKIGSPPNTSEVDFTGNEPVNRASNSIVLTSSYQELASATVGREAEFTQGGANYTRTQYIVCALIYYSHLRNDVGGEFNFEVDMQLEALDPNGLGTSTTFTDTSPVVSTYGAPPTWGFRTYPDPPATLGTGQLLGLGVEQTLFRHSLSGLLPATELGPLSSRAQLIKQTFIDEHTALVRLVRLSLKIDAVTGAAAGTVDGAPCVFAPRAHLLGFNVSTAPILNDLPAPDRLGG